MSSSNQRRFAIGKLCDSDQNLDIKAADYVAARIFEECSDAGLLNGA